MALPARLRDRTRGPDPRGSGSLPPFSGSTPADTNALSTGAERPRMWASSPVSCRVNRRTSAGVNQPAARFRQSPHRPTNAAVSEHATAKRSANRREPSRLMDVTSVVCWRGSSANELRRRHRSPKSNREHNSFQARSPSARLRFLGSSRRRSASCRASCVAALSGTRPHTPGGTGKSPVDRVPTRATSAEKWRVRQGDHLVWLRLHAPPAMIRAAIA